MAQDSENRFHSIMDKLFHAPKSRSNSSPSTSGSTGLQLSGNKRPYQSTALGGIDLNRRGDVAEGQQSSSAAAGTQGPLCRPWDRGDFVRRLATFKSISWFAKPKAVSAVNCARRGWINVDIDTIACEVCGARLLFSTPASWNQQQVEKAALVFSIKLDTGHKLLCPWIDNVCDETLARFPPTPSQVLVDNFGECCSVLLQLSSLPRILSSAIDYMESPLLEDFLGQSLMPEHENGSANISGVGNVSSQHEANLYYQAQLLISLCGWKLRALPYVVDTSNQSVKNATILDCSQVVTDMKNNGLASHSANTDESSKTDVMSKDSGEQIDPNSVVLYCTLCGATVGLWAFSSIPRPVELIRLVGYTELNSEKDSTSSNLSNNNYVEDNQNVTNTMSVVATSSQNISSGLNMTIAEGPPPTKQNFKAIISLPVIGQNLRARLSYNSDLSGNALVNEDIQSDSRKKMRIQENPDYTVSASIGQLVPMSAETREVSDYVTGSQAQPSSYKDKMPVHTEADGLNGSAAGDPSSSQKDLTEGEALSIVQKTLGGEVCSLENLGVKGQVDNPSNCEDMNCGLGKDLRSTLLVKAVEFNPIRQHRHFCPWIATINDGEPGWKQTLSALYHQKNNLPSSSNGSPSSLPIVKVDDPVGSVRKLFMSPSTRRMKVTHNSGQTTEHR